MTHQTDGPWAKVEPEYPEFQLDAWKNPNTGNYLVVERMAEKRWGDGPLYQTIIVDELDAAYAKKQLARKVSEEDARMAAHEYVSGDE